MMNYLVEKKKEDDERKLLIKKDNEEGKEDSVTNPAFNNDNGICQKWLEKPQKKSEFWKELKEVISDAYDTAIPGFNNSNCNKLRL